MSLYKNKYRTETTRLSNWDYSWQASYFVTICTKYMIPFFGEIRNGIMGLNELGIIVHGEWEKTAGMRPDMNLALGAVVVMPNHFHAIIHIGRNEFNNLDAGPLPDAPIGGSRDALQSDNTIRNKPVSYSDAPIDGSGDALQCVSTTPSGGNVSKTSGQFGPQRKNLSSIIRGFKGAVTKQVREIDPTFAWQPRFYDYIIREPVVYQKIENYIIENPRKWREDRFHR